MLKNLHKLKILFTITISFALIAAITGIFTPNIYNGIAAPQFLPGALAQDILTAILCLTSLLIIQRLKANDYKNQILILGFIGSLFYLYGIFVIEQVYNQFYYLYLCVFGLSFWSIIISILNLETDKLKQLNLPSKTSKISSIFALIIATLFSFLWVSALWPLLQTRTRIEYLFSIYILDLCFIMPAFFITAILTLKKQIIGIIFLPFVYIIGFFVIFPLGLNEISKPFYAQTIDYNSMIMSFVFSALMLITAIFHIKKMNLPTK